MNKFLLNNNELILYNYKEIVKISENMIQTMDYIIDVDDLVLKKMDSYELIIKGKVKKIIIL